MTLIIMQKQVYVDEFSQNVQVIKNHFITTMRTSDNYHIQIRIISKIKINRNNILCPLHNFMAAVLGI